MIGYILIAIISQIVGGTLGIILFSVVIMPKLTDDRLDFYERYQIGKGDIMDDLRQLYNSNDDFRGYVDRYSVSRKITPAEALYHAYVIEYARYLKEKEAENGTRK